MVARSGSSSESLRLVLAEGALLTATHPVLVGRTFLLPAGLKEPECSSYQHYDHKVAQMTQSRSEALRSARASSHLETASNAKVHSVAGISGAAAMHQFSEIQRILYHFSHVFYISMLVFVM